MNLPVGGIASQTLESLTSFEKIEDLKISLITKYSEYKPLTDRIKIYTLHKFKNSKVDTLYFFYKLIIKIAKITKMEPVDFICIHSFYYNLIPSLILSSLFKIPIFITTPTDFSTGQKEEFLSKRFKLISRIIFYSWMRFLKEVIIRKKRLYIQATNEKIYQDFINWDIKKENLVQISNGIYSNKYLALQKDKNDTIHFGFLGRLIKSKNIRFMLKVFRKYLELYPRDKLFIFGKGSEERFIRQFIIENHLSDHIKYCGFLSKFDVYPKLDVLIHPSLGEGTPMTILEANLTDTFVIASNVSNSNRIIFDNQTGLLFNPYKMNSLLNKLVFFKEHQEIVQDILKRAKDNVLLNYEMDMIAKRIVEFLKSKL